MHWISLINLILCLIISSTCIRPPPFSKNNRKPNELVGGRAARNGEVKYIVLIKDGHGICGGGIIGENHILTAAHCIDINKKTGTLLYPIEIVGGTNVAYGYSKSAVIVRNVTKAYFPGPYVEDGGYYDIAVLEVSSPLNLLSNHEKLQELKLPEPSSDNPIEYPTYEGAIVKFAGYGDTRAYDFERNGKWETKSSGAGRLKVAQAEIDDAETCEIIAKDRPDQICVSINEDKSKSRPQGTCTGDSGGPAVYNGNTVIGVTSMGSRCDNNVFPTLFSRVSYYVPFIKKALIGNSEGLLVYRACTKEECTA